MAKKKIRHQQKNRPTNQRKQKLFHWQKALQKSVISLAFLIVIAIPIAFYSNKIAAEHDLSVIGNGIATVVQIHDPGCQLCAQLKRNVKATESEFKDKIQFKTANITTQKGRQFARKHNVSHVTLLLFDQKGRRANTLQGVSTTKEIRAALRALAHAR